MGAVRVGGLIMRSYHVHVGSARSPRLLSRGGRAVFMLLWLPGALAAAYSKLN